MKTYELFLILSPELDDPAIDKQVREVEALLAKSKGKILEVAKKGKKKLSYPMADFRDANQVLLKVEAAPDSLVVFRKQISIMPNILRMLVQVQEPVAA